ncbi:hypothetical protein FLBR109950_05535 [Flavobacterium branchiophilum]|uniref:DUF3575 domain-containing protein n=2 Tax=Flavobacterium branchiophilum TaxID=55197 RepID=G2Z341_FLABF|nr:hypothetical protein [Flavobacterium branchiophilum]PDS25779.1 hypothetical protein B0A77_03860 [Flavobacterium branchiophilum]CCB70387.1 Hypothetical protein precursor [Flavobacterium branchiophilum FL-15]
MKKNGIRTVFMMLGLFVIQVHAQDFEGRKWKPSFQLDNRFSSINSINITIFGAKVGMQYNKLARIGIGGSFIVNPVSFDYYNKKKKINETNVLHFWYLSVFNDWIIYKDNRWQVFATEQIGYGKPRFQKEINDEIVSNVNRNLIVNEFSAQVNYKVVPWFGLGTGIGYRHILNGEATLKQTFDAPIYIVKVIVYPENIIRLKRKE